MSQRQPEGGVLSSTPPPFITPPVEPPAWFSPDQQRLWFLEQLHPGAPIHHVGQALHLTGPVHLAELRLAVRRAGERVAAAVRPPGWQRSGAPMPAVELETARAELAGGMDQAAQAFLRRPFDLLYGPYLRALWLPEAEDEAAGGQLVVVWHRLAGDEAALQHLIAALWADYHDYQAANDQIDVAARAAVEQLRRDNVRRGNATSLPAPPSDQTHLAYWLAQLADPPPPLDLPGDYPRPARQSFRGRQYSFDLAIAELAAGQPAEPLALCLAALYALVYRYTGRRDHVVGLVRPSAGLGQHGNILPLRTRWHGAITWEQLVVQTAAVVQAGRAHGDVSLAQLLEALQPVRSLSHPPLFQLICHDVAAPAAPAPSLPWRELDWGVCEYDLQLRLRPGPAGWQVVIQYNQDIFEAETIQRLAGHYQQLCQGGLANPATPLDRLPLLTPAEYQMLQQWQETLPVTPEKQGKNRQDAKSAKIIHESTRTTEYTEYTEGNAKTQGREGDSQFPIPDSSLPPQAQLARTATAWSPPATLTAWLEEQAARSPQAIALVGEDETVTYAALHEQANELAYALQAQGVGPEVAVGVYLERTPALVVALLAVLKAGGFYVPLDPHYPAARLGFMLADSGAAVVVTDHSHQDDACLGDIPRLVVGSNWQRSGAPATLTPPHPQQLAYLIYTSGSTGRPKAVAITHHNVVALLAWARTIFTPAECAGVLAATSIAFDLSVFELFLPLTCGGRIILAANALHLPQLRAREQVTLINTVPSAMTELVRAHAIPAGVQTINLAGESLSRQLAQQIFAQHPTVRLYNLYGPSEDTTYSTWAHIIFDADGSAPSIGRPITGTRAYILDANLEPVPVGVPGELYLAGAGVARGYLGRPALTAERFLPDRDGGRMYRTGDLVRYRANGEITFLGRLDHQVKVRGFRIELGEIEAALRQQPGVRAAVVIVREDTPGDRQLVAYLEGDQEEAAGLRRRLRAQLPDYMLPAAYVWLPALPLTPNGKVDRRALPAPTPEQAAREAKSEEASRPTFHPRLPTATAVAAIWHDVLGVANIGLQENFFELGGHSLHAAQVVQRLNQHFRVQLPLTLLFEHPTLADVVEALENAPPILPALEERHDRLAPFPLSPAQRQLWFLAQLQPDNPWYTIPALFEIQEAVTPTEVQAWLDDLVRQHEALRTAFTTVAETGEPRQVVQPPRPMAFAFHDLRAQPEAAEALLAQAARRVFDLTAGYLAHATLVQLADEHFQLLLALHHIIADGWSLGVLLASAPLVDGRRSGEAGWQFRDYVLWQAKLLEGQATPEMPNRAMLQAYWQQQLAGLPPLLELPADRPRPPRPTRRGAREQLTLPATLLAALEGLGRSENATLNMALLTAFEVLLARLTGQMDFVIGMPLAGRPLPELEGIVGMFVNNVPLRADVTGNPTCRTLLRRVRQATLGALAHQAIPLETVLRDLRLTHGRGDNPLFRVVFAPQTPPSGTGDGRIRLIEEMGNGTAKFDLTLFVTGRDAATPSPLPGRITAEYNSDLFEPATIRRLLQLYQTLLFSMAADPDASVLDLAWLTPEEERDILWRWNQTTRPYPGTATVAQLFHQQAMATPDRPALLDGETGQTWRYAEVQAQANALAQRLHSCGVQAGAYVGLFMERSPAMAIACLAVLQLGAGYVPLDPTYPAGRLRFMLHDTQAALIVTQPALLANHAWLDDPTLPPRLVLDWDAIGQAGQDGGSGKAWNIVGQVDGPASPAGPTTKRTAFETAGGGPHSAAYVMYTSGSTGRPKGVVVSHQNIVRLVSHTNYITLQPEDVVAHLSNTAFDAATFELWGAWLNGACLAVIPRAVALSAPALAACLERCGVTVMFLTTALFNQLAWEAPDMFQRLRVVLFGGEAADPSAVRQVWQHGPPQRLLNAYGPTESTTFAACYPIGDEALALPLLPIGYPISHTLLHIVDSQLRPVPIGVPGELLIGGDGLAWGYLQRPDLTAQVFIPNPFVAGLGPGAVGSRLYRTGDLARYRADGAIEFLGRRDFQIKLRGFRIELGEIEAALTRHPAVQSALVIVHPHHSSEKQPIVNHSQLVAYVGTSQAPPPTARDLRQHLQASLPDYMLPALFICLPALPINPNGKIDRQALPAPDWEQREEMFEPPATPFEEIVADVWQEVLGVTQLGRYDNFFERGGHSLLATQVMSRLQARFELKLPLTIVFDAPVLADLASAVEEALVAEVAALDEAEVAHLLAPRD